MPLYMQTRLNGSYGDHPARTNQSVRVLKQWASLDGTRQHLLIEAPSAESVAGGPEDELVELFGTTSRWMSVAQVEG